MPRFTSYHAYTEAFTSNGLVYFFVIFGLVISFSFISHDYEKCNSKAKKQGYRLHNVSRH